MALLLLSYPISFYVSGSGQNVLLIGDSLDRWIVHDICGHYESYHGKDSAILEHWGDNSIKYGDGHTKQATIICRIKSSNASIASLHILGSNLYGPYLYVDTRRDSMAPTGARISKALQLYYEQVGRPDRVVINTVLWDLRDFHEHGAINSTSPEWNAALDKLGADFNRLVSFVETMLSDEQSNYSLPAIDVALRTTPWSDDCGIGCLVDAYNEIVRNVSYTRGFTLFDYDQEVWARYNNNRTLLPELYRDHSHPSPALAANAGLNLLGQLDSQWFRYYRRRFTDSCTSPYQSEFYRRKYVVNELIRASNSKTIYLVGSDLLLHMIPDFNTFLSLGRDLDEVTIVEPLQMVVARFGNPLPPVRN